MSRPPPLTQQAQAAVAAVLSPGAFAIDATMGNGHDTLFLAHRVAPDGRVIAFDVQPAALEATRRRLQAAGLLPLVELRQCGHEHLLEVLPADWPGRVAAVMFNLGYLPGSDKRVITRAENTVPALRQAVEVLRPGGIVSVMLYRGHPGANGETEALDRWLGGLPAGCRVERRESPGPVLFLITRPAGP
jgi:predicted methyltransferase